MIKRPALYFLLMVAFLSLACEKEKLTPATQTGANSLSCKINGKNWVPNGIGFLNRLDPVKGDYYANRSLFIRAYGEEEDVNTSLYIYLNDVVKPGEYPLNFDTYILPGEKNPKNYGYYNVRVTNPGTEYVTTSQYTGKVLITRADTVAGIVSGTFEFTAVNIQNPSETVSITKGRFDVGPKVK